MTCAHRLRTGLLPRGCNYDRLCHNVHHIQGRACPASALMITAWFGQGLVVDISVVAVEDWGPRTTAQSRFAYCRYASAFLVCLVAPYRCSLHRCTMQRSERCGVDCECRCADRQHAERHLRWPIRARVLPGFLPRHSVCAATTRRLAFCEPAVAELVLHWSPFCDCLQS